jgi:type IV pilus assembly protein PilB
VVASFEVPDSSESRIGEGEQDSSPSTDASAGRRSRPYVASFLQYLIKNQIVSEDTALLASSARQASNGKTRRTLVDILVTDFGMPREVLYDQVARFYSFRIIDINERSTRKLLPSTVSKILLGLHETISQLAIKHKVLPYETAENQPEKILVVTPNPLSREASGVARYFPYKKFEICYLREQDWDDFWRQVSREMEIAVRGLDPLQSQFEIEEVDLDSVLDMEINRGQLVALIENVFADAVRVGASDIHVVPRGARKTSVLFRIDGQLSEWFCIEDSRAEAVIAVVKGRGLGLDRFERMAAQDGSAQKVVDNVTIRFRMSVLPVISRELTGKFESVVIRILKDADASVSLETIGFDSYSLQWFREAIAKPHGMVILTGPTGCGKSTTLIAALRTVMKPTLNTITVEDPVEYLIDGARQVKLNHKLSFDDAMRSILRHDPDIVMVGEIRDHITADISIKLANTGHLTFTSLHTNDAPSAVSRLFKIGVEPFLIAQALNIVVAQRLVRKLCIGCRQPVESLDDHLLAKVGFSQDDADRGTFFKAVGCPHCVGGYKGRTAIHETLYVTQRIRDIILDSTSKIDVDEIRAEAVAHGMSSLRVAGLELVKKGVTTIEEVISTTAHE